jgi:hypothetical protein
MTDNKMTPRAIAELAEQLFAGDLGYDEFIRSVPKASDDQNVSELIDLIVHEPTVGGPEGISPEEHDEYLARVDSLILKLKGE